MPHRAIYLSNPQFGNIHPYAPEDQTEGYIEMLHTILRSTSPPSLGFVTSLHPNSGASGEFAGLRPRRYHESRGEDTDTLCYYLPQHTAPTLPVHQAGYDVVIAKSDEHGNIDIEDFRAKAEQPQRELPRTMITYPSTHGIFEPEIRQLIDIVHECGGQVYMDGANMNAQVGYTSPGFMGADVCHLNLHKTLLSPTAVVDQAWTQGVARHLAEFLPSHAVAYGHDHIPVSSAPYGSAVINGITYAYIRLLGTEGLKRATAIAILSAIIFATLLKDEYGITYTGATGFAVTS